MELWKIGVIVALVLAVVGYKAYDENKSAEVIPSPSGTPAGPEVPSPLLGTTPPAWVIPSPKDWVNTPKPVTLPSLKGSIAVVEIFRIDCSHCQDAAPIMEALAAHYIPKGVKFVGIQSPGRYKDVMNPENDWGAVKQWLKERNVIYPVAMDRNSKYFQGTFPLEEKLYPCMFVLDKSGKIALFQTGVDAKKMVKLAAGIERQMGTGSGLEARTNVLAGLLSQFPMFAKNTKDELQKMLNEWALTPPGSKKAA